MDSGRICVVRGLRAVHMVVRRAVLVFTPLMPHQLQGTVGDYLIRIHIRSGTRSTLDHIHRELVMMFTFDDLTASGDDRILLLYGKQA